MIDLLFVILPHSCALDWAGPAEAFRIANQTLERQGKNAAFNMRFIGPQVLNGQAVSSVGAQLMQLDPLPKKLTPPSWVVLLGSPDEHLNLSSPPVRALDAWLRSISPELKAPHRLITVCAGALLAAQAGLLAGAQVTTHHLELDALRRLEPRAQVLANRIFVSDVERNIYSSAGITTGIDLAVVLIAEMCGEAVAARVAQVMVMPMRRSASDPQLSAFLSHRAHLHPAVHRVQDALSLAPQQVWTAETIAQVACTSTRHLNRLFDEHVGMSPLDFLRNIRVELAAKALQSGKSVAQTAVLCGFSSDLQMRRAWRAAGRESLPSNAKQH